MKVSEAIKFLEQLDGESEVTIICDKGIVLRPGIPSPPTKSDQPFVGYPTHRYVPTPFPNLPMYPPSPNTIWCTSTTEYKQ